MLCVFGNKESFHSLLEWSFEQDSNQQQSNPNPELLRLVGLWATDRLKDENCFRSFGACHAKTCLKPDANSEGANQPAHPRSLISTFVVRCLGSMICLLAISKVSRF